MIVLPATADRIRLIGPAATGFCFQSLTERRIQLGRRCDAVEQYRTEARSSLFENRLAHETGKRADQTPLQAKLPELCTEILDPSLSVKNDATFA